VVILLLILAASMSTLASLVLVSGSTLTKDFYHGFIRKDAPDARLTSLSRISSAFFILLSMLLAALKPAVIVTILSVSWGAIAAVFLGPFIWGLLCGRTGRVEAIVASIAGITSCMVLFFVWGPSMVPQAASVGMLVSLILPAFGLLMRRGAPRI
jgi:Na+/proline symporter